jgi:hypothetical protein
LTLPKARGGNQPLEAAASRSQDRAAGVKRLRSPAARGTLAILDESDRPHDPDIATTAAVTALARLRSLPVDRRQSLVASCLQRGVRRFFAQLGQCSLPEVGLPNGRRADVVALSPDGCLTIVEIKSSVADFRADRKWPDYRPFCDRFYFAIPHEVPCDIIPDHAG